MKNKKIVLWIALVVTAIITACAQQYNSEKDFEIDWDEDVEGGVVINKYIGTKKEVRIPPSIQNYPVTSIGKEAFFMKENITRVIIPNSVKRIEDGYSDGNHDHGAFTGCTRLTSITIGNSVTSIGVVAFEGCTKLTSVSIPKSVISIGAVAFEGCTKLTRVTIGNGVTSIGKMAFASCTSLTSITIPDSVTSIGEVAFYNCTSLTSVTIGNGVTSIGRNTFTSCTSLTSITIPNSVTSIGEVAFWKCTSLTSITIPDIKDIASFT